MGRRRDSALLTQTLRRFRDGPSLRAQEQERIPHVFLLSSWTTTGSEARRRERFRFARHNRARADPQSVR
jgi:hypothetical protein